MTTDDDFTDTDVAEAEALTDAPAEADAAFDLILLDPARVLLFRTGGAVVRATISDPVLGAERSFIRVQIARAFPLSDPDQYIGLRDGKDKDIGMLQTLTGLDAASRRIVDEELTRRYFVPKVVRVHAVKEEFGTVTWDVETDKGPRKFIVQNLRDSVQELGPTRLLLTDKDGVRYEFDHTDRLDAKSRFVLSKVQ